MNISNFFHILNKKQKKILLDEIEKILNNCDKIAKKEWKEQLENQQFNDNVCPICHARQDNKVNFPAIVNKIRDVQGSSKINNHINFFGFVNSSISISTHEINHCNVCGNEWKKFKTKYVTKTDIVKVALKYLGEYYKDPEHQQKFSWKMEAIQVFDGCYAESIKLLVNKYKKNIYTSTKKQLTLFNLKLNHKSIFDKIK